MTPPPSPSRATDPTSPTAPTDPTTGADSEAARELLRDQFGRIRELVEARCDGLTPDVSDYRPDGAANSVAWLLWHLARVQDSHVADAAGTEQVWTTQGWAARFALPFDDDVIGYGQDPDEAGQVHADAAYLDGYHQAVHAATLAYVDRVDAAELARVVDENWDPPVTVSVRLVSVVGDCLQHLGQAAYVAGLAQRAGR